MFTVGLATADQVQIEPLGEPTKSCVTIGVLNGGGSLIGADFESMIAERMSLQIGFGLIGFGGGLNFHFKPTVMSSAISFGFMNQGLAGDNLSQRLLGVSYLFRHRGGFTAQLGLGYVLEMG